MWHELVLHGIGGRTVAEAKERMSYAEYLDWVSFMRMRGSIDLGQRLDHGFALIATLISRATGGKAEMKDFLMTKPREQQASIQDVFGVLMSSAQKTKAASLMAKKGRG